MKPIDSDFYDRQKLLKDAYRSLSRAWANLRKSGANLGDRSLSARPPFPEIQYKPQEHTHPDYVDPPLIIAGDDNIELNVAYASGVIGEDPVHLRMYNGNLVGPTIQVRPGQTLNISVVNDLPVELNTNPMNTLGEFNTTNLHTHGLHVYPSGISDNVLLHVQPQTTQLYQIEIPPYHIAGTFWYHAHNHGSTAANVGSGMSGALIIQGTDPAYQEKFPGKLQDITDIEELQGITIRTIVLNQISYIIPIPPAKQEGIIENEPEFIGPIFSPSAWDTLGNGVYNPNDNKGRYTTINGLKFPKIRMTPGSVERWRFVNSAMREPIYLQLTSAVNPKDILPLYEIATDGIPTRKVRRHQYDVQYPVVGYKPEDLNDLDYGRLELWPGYRSDVLVFAPTKPGHYILRDTRLTDFKPVQRGYLALIEITDEKPIGVDPQTVLNALNEKLDQYCPDSLKDKPVDGYQTVRYGLFVQGGNTTFTVDNHSFSGTNVRQLKKDTIEEWTAISKNDLTIGPVSHPFHIHVNPFEVLSIIDQNGTQKVIGEPVWKDTLVLNQGEKSTFRTRYDDFIGMFVQHCHILDHEDSGMMEIVEIFNKDNQPEYTEIRRPVLAPKMVLYDACGRPHPWDPTTLQRTTVIFLFEKTECIGCANLIKGFVNDYPTFQANNIDVMGISSGTIKDLKKGLKGAQIPFNIYVDVSGTIFRDFGLAEGLHGTFILNRSGYKRYQVTSSIPLYNEVKSTDGTTVEHVQATLDLAIKVNNEKDKQPEE